ncbi:MAG: hypothetical protein ABUS79_24275 [Pseudomonadota bacterium]
MIATLGAAAIVAGTPALVRAENDDQAGARALFAEGRQLMKKGDYAAACPKLEAARKLYTSAGILLNLGDCYEHVGKLASAWTEFGEAATVADRSNRADDAAEARRRQQAVEPSLPRLTVRVEHPVPGLVLKRDSVVLAEPAWGTGLPVDPGNHAVTAEAGGYELWSTSVSVDKPGVALTVDVPELRAAPAPAVAVAKPSDREQPAASSHVLAWTLIGAGAAVAAGGAVLMLVEAKQAQDARDHNDQAKYDSARTPWTVGLVGAIAGGVAAATGVVLFVTARQSGESPTTTNVSAWVAPDSGGVLLFGAW